MFVHAPSAKSHIFECMCVSIFIYVYMSWSSFLNEHDIYIYIYIYERYINIYICIYLYIFIYIYIHTYIFIFLIKIYFKEKFKPTTRGTWFGQSGKGRNNPRQYSTKKLPPTICRELLLGPSVRIRGPDCQCRKNCQQKGFVTRFLNSCISNR